MRERPILFTGPMVKAILAGKKHQTRRVMTPQPDTSTPGYWAWSPKRGVSHGLATAFLDSPFGVVGDRLWVRETWSPHCRNGKQCEPADATFVVFGGGGQKYRDGTYVQPLAEYVPGAFSNCKWRPSIYMPRWASRITLAVTSVRAERLHDITAEDALSEGVGETPFWRPKEVDENPKPTHEWAEPYWDDFYFWHHYPQRAFAGLWDSINAKRAPWASNPWVFVVVFELLELGKGGT